MLFRAVGQRPVLAVLVAAVGISLAADLELAATTSRGRDSILLTLQPVLSVIFAALIIDESPSKLQLGGAGCILAGLIVATAGRRQVQTPEPELAG